MDFVQRIFRGVVHSLGIRSYKKLLDSRHMELKGTLPRIAMDIWQLDLGERKLVQKLDQLFKCGKEEVEIAVYRGFHKKTVCSSILDREHFYSSESYLKYFSAGNLN